MDWEELRYILIAVYISDNIFTIISYKTYIPYWDIFRHNVLNIDKNIPILYIVYIMRYVING